MMAFLATHSTLGGQFAERIGLPSRLVRLASPVKVSAAAMASRWHGRSSQAPGDPVRPCSPKLGVSSRAAATLFAIQHGLLGNFEHA
jgi:hypothetical protein